MQQSVHWKVVVPIIIHGQVVSNRLRAAKISSAWKTSPWDLSCTRWALSVVDYKVTLIHYACPPTSLQQCKDLFTLTSRNWTELNSTRSKRVQNCEPLVKGVFHCAKNRDWNRQTMFHYPENRDWKLILISRGYFTKKIGLSSADCLHSGTGYIEIAVFVSCQFQSRF